MRERIFLKHVKDYSKRHNKSGLIEMKKKKTLTNKKRSINKMKVLENQ